MEIIYLQVKQNNFDWQSDTFEWRIFLIELAWLNILCLCTNLYLRRLNFAIYRSSTGLMRLNIATKMIKMWRLVCVAECVAPMKLLWVLRTILNFRMRVVGFHQLYIFKKDDLCVSCKYQILSDKFEIVILVQTKRKKTLSIIQYLLTFTCISCVKNYHTMQIDPQSPNLGYINYILIFNQRVL